MSTKQMKKMGYVILVVFIISMFYLFGPGCPQQALFGISCLGCGMTRAYLQLFQGNVKGAFFYHPLFPQLISHSLFQVERVLLRRRS